VDESLCRWLLAISVTIPLIVTISMKYITQDDK
jgi:hypothetical protein